jgi:glucose uptake protein GlcU
MKFNSYFKNEKLPKIIMGVLLFVMILLVVGIVAVKAEDNKTTDEPVFTERGFPKILDDDKWVSQLVYDTINACYQGTIRWVVMSNPSLLGRIPAPIAQRQMVEHCFCVMDMIRKENKIEEYVKKVIDPQWGGNLFMLKAVECVRKYATLPSFFMKLPMPDNATKTDDEKVEKLKVLPAEPEGLEESSPDEKLKDQQTILQG